MISDLSQIKLPPYSWPVVLRAGGLLLRPLKRRDKKQWEKLQKTNQKWLEKWNATIPLGTGAPLSFVEQVRVSNLQAKEGSALPLGICWDDSAGVKRDDPYRIPIIGLVSVMNIVWGSCRMGAIGYWISKEYAGRGITPMAVALVSDFCFIRMKLHRLEINIRPENSASLRVVEKLGFRYEGLRKNYIHINGQWCDHCSFALVAEETKGSLLRTFLFS